ncbi:MULTISPECIES: bifunctional phosphoribosylaminoimidazolecarboxamide formyltransferase/IMP cyclohydrolase [Petrotoga]|uniref:Bifunctional purine biosynthesis protein PurH n=2 Tax=Petrotoga sibirica TaxID=156202 RepID=A0A4R8EKX1_9BACT|nr:MULTISPECIES: bifunctional phosphoribosylaminoimidazolecarboxamide formyltransferase/IMP cyclohydrolase [Petrotoga]POZ87819.1 phosphoribosylaminoimidazolecarboxamide formyltransferase [Petrotoga sibirica DSM 13575]POZ89859.1 phosphoribosylaminoimidazolecarboxamide formyltransferase [Petrotoga sp. SL27]TDX11138.1 phosphoribosylaminoimidazolecarboxamide formyltransferase/IMP cyclohydrolase [Petrotoga sibirica]
MIKRALLSTYKKDKVVDFARTLQEVEIEVISTGGTAKKLQDNGIEVTPVEEITNFPEILNGRVKTLNPFIHGGILARRENEQDMETLKNLNIEPIDLVYVNLYPFVEEAKKTNFDLDELIEFIDIGGPTMIRSAAKNYKDVIVVVDESDLEYISAKLKNKEEFDEKYRMYLASKAFNLTAFYDSCISNYLNAQLKDKDDFQQFLTVPFEKSYQMRYGENPHQSAIFYKNTLNNGSMTSFDQLNGKELSFNNLRDADSAWKAVNEFEDIACCCLKHSSPCGIALGDSILEAYKKAYSCDPVSIFGGIVAFNRKVDVETALELKKLFLEIIMAPEYDEVALDILKKKKNLRILRMSSKPIDTYEYVSVDGGILVQEVDKGVINEFKVVTETKVPEEIKEELLFAWKAVKHVKSNAIVVSKNKATTGIGPGQPNRVWSALQALERSKGKGGDVLASDAFFPFSDVVEAAAEYGIKAIIQPGGSIRDDESIQACNKYGIAMIFTGMRHFKHI